MNRLLAGLLLGLLSATVVHAQSSVWRVQGAEYSLYLGGTVHVLSAQDLPLPEVYHRVFDTTDTLVLETDLNVLMQPQTQMQMAQALRYPDGQRLTQFVSAETYGALEAHAQRLGLPPGLFESMRPSGVAITLLALELRKAGITQSGVDMIFFQQASQAGKPISGLETPERHLAYLSSMGEGLEDQFIRQTLEDIGATVSSVREIVDAWRSGDTAALEEAVIADMAERYPKLYDELLVSRNRAWMPQLEAMLTTEAEEFVLVGAAHLLGADGLLAQLQAQGYKITQLD